MALGTDVTAKANRFCGRFLNPTAAEVASVSVCCKFNVKFTSTKD